MILHPSPRATLRPCIIAALTATVALTMTVMAAAPAQATTPRGSTTSRGSALPGASAPPLLPTQLTAAIAKAGLNLQQNDGWEAVTGFAGDVNCVRALATSLGIGSLAEYTKNDEAGQAILIFSGNDENSVGFSVIGATATSAANETHQTWTVSRPGDDKPDAILRPGTAESISPVNGVWDLVGTALTVYVRFFF